MVLKVREVRSAREAAWAAQMAWDNWGEDFQRLTPHKTKAQLTAFYEAMVAAGGGGSGGSRGWPACYVAVEGDEPVACAVVDVEDMGVRPDLSPWLANVCVAPGVRGRGYGSALVRAVASSYPLLHLWAIGGGLDRFYGRLGFEPIGRSPLEGHEEAVTVMRRRGFSRHGL